MYTTLTSMTYCDVGFKSLAVTAATFLLISLKTCLFCPKYIIVNIFGSDTQFLFPKAKIYK